MYVYNFDMKTISKLQTNSFFYVKNDYRDIAMVEKYYLLTFLLK